MAHQVLRPESGAAGQFEDAPVGSKVRQRLSNDLSFGKPLAI
jgi:hypothetical protein